MQRIPLDNKTILLTGAAGFIGAALTERLLNLKDAKGQPVPLRIFRIGRRTVSGPAA